MISRNEILEYANDAYATLPDYPWIKTPDYAILRHGNNRKWFCAIINITEDKLGLNSNKMIDALLLKCDPVLISLLHGEPGILPAYHMNKEHWITVLLDGSCPKERVFELIDLSYNLTKPKISKR